MSEDKTHHLQRLKTKEYMLFSGHSKLLFFFFQSCKAVVGRKKKHKKSSYVGPSEYVSLCLCWRLLVDLSPLGDAGEFNFVLHPLPALQQTVKHKGEPRQSNCAHNLHQ